ncbi:MAG: thioredoxin [Bacteroidales bacterium]|nr:thioredoxin [Bacteroidales bacterium]
MAVEHLTTNGFLQKVATVDKEKGRLEFLGTRPAVVDFYAAWCGPCRMLSPLLEDLALEYEGKVDFYKINVDEEENLSSMFDIRSIPTLLLFSRHTTMQRVRGAVGKAQLKDIIESTLLS